MTNTDTKSKEIEFKYSAKNISLWEFIKYCRKKLPKTQMTVSGFDHFFYNPEQPDCFYRHRRGQAFSQLTFKRKLTPKNNVIRTEHNITLDFATSNEQIEDFCKEFGFAKNVSLFKTCFIFNYEDHILSYYVVSDINLKEIGRFVEIELNEEYPWPNSSAAYDRLRELEDLIPFAKDLARVNPSLFEMFKK